MNWETDSGELQILVDYDIYKAVESCALEEISQSPFEREFMQGMETSAGFFGFLAPFLITLTALTLFFAALRWLHKAISPKPRGGTWVNTDDISPLHEEDVFVVIERGDDDWQTAQFRNGEWFTGSGHDVWDSPITVDRVLKLDVKQ